MAEPIGMPFGVWSWVGCRNHNFSRIVEGHIGIYLANTIKLSVCSSNEALCQITLTTCLILITFAGSLSPADQYAERSSSSGLLPLPRTSPRKRQAESGLLKATDIGPGI